MSYVAKVVISEQKSKVALIFLQRAPNTFVSGKVSDKFCVTKETTSFFIYKQRAPRTNLHGACCIYAITKQQPIKNCIVVLSCFILCLCYWEAPRCESGSLCFLYIESCCCSQKQPSKYCSTLSMGASNRPNNADPEPLMDAYLAPN